MVNSRLRLCMGCMNYVDEDSVVCNICDNNKLKGNNSVFLKTGSILNNKYIIGKTLSYNGESVVYIGKNTNDNEKYYVKEYSPHILVNRLRTGELSPKAGQEAQYKMFMVDFLDLNQMLKSLGDIPCLMPMKDILIYNKTVYIIYLYVKLIKYESYLEKHWKLSWNVCKDWFISLNELLIKTHSKGIIHRGISPQTVYFDVNKKIYIHDFAIPCLRTKTTQITYQLFEGFSSPEQYFSNKWQGEWTDVYSIACLILKTLTGRLLNELPADFFTCSSDLNVNIPSNVLNALKRALCSDYKERTQTIQQLNHQLLGDSREESKLESTMIFDVDKTISIKSDEELNYQEFEHNKIKTVNLDRKKNGVKKITKTILIVILSIFIASAIVGAVLYFLSNSNYGKIPQKLELHSNYSENDNKSDIKNAEILRVPNFIGEKYEDIVKNSVYSDFTIKQKFNFDDTVPAGVIISQDPDAFSSYKKGVLSTITLTVSNGIELVDMPDIINKNVDDATKILNNAFIKYEKIYVKKDGVKDNIVYDTNKKIGDKIKKDKEKILLYIKQIET